MYQYYTDTVGLLWAGGDNESGIADYQVAAMASVSADGSVDDDGALMAFTPTHKQNYLRAVRFGAIDTVPFMYYCIQASNKYVTCYGPLLIHTGRRRRQKSIWAPSPSIVMRLCRLLRKL
jgi:hypothetical protein